MVCFSDNVQPGPSMHKLLTIVIMICISSIDVVIIPNVIGNGSYFLGAAVAVDNVYIVHFFLSFGVQQWWPAFDKCLLWVTSAPTSPPLTPKPLEQPHSKQLQGSCCCSIQHFGLLGMYFYSSLLYQPTQVSSQPETHIDPGMAATVPLKNLDGAFSMPNKATKIPLVSETPWCV